MNIEVNHTAATTRNAPRWLHVWAVVCVVVTSVLLILGGLVIVSLGARRKVRRELAARGLEKRR